MKSSKAKNVDGKKRRCKKMQRDSKRLKEQHEEKTRRIKELKQQLEELEKDDDDQQDEYDDEEWEEWNNRKSTWTHYEEEKTPTSKDSSYVFVEAPEEGTPTKRKTSKDTSPKKGDADQDVTMEGLQTKAFQMMLESQKQTLELILGNNVKGLSEAEKLDQEDQRIKEVELGKLEELSENASIACGD